MFRCLNAFRLSAFLTICACVALSSAADESAEPVWGRVLGVYSRHKTQSVGSPEFPFYSQMEINADAIETTASASVVDTSTIPADELATLPSDAFTFTAYVNKGSTGTRIFTTPAIFTPGATYRMNFYVNEPYSVKCRSQYAAINGTRIKDENDEDFWFYPSDINLSGNHAVDKVWKMVFSNVVARADGTITWSFPTKSDNPTMNIVTFDGTNLPVRPVVSARAVNNRQTALSWNVCRDTLAYIVERSTDNGASWTELGRTKETSFEDLASDSDARSYRVVASNGVGVATSDVVSANFRRVLAALHLGQPGRVLGRFVPADPFVSGFYKSRTTGAPREVPFEIQDSEDVFTAFAYLYSEGLTFAFTNLTPNAFYDMRIWTMEVWNAISSDDYRRFSVSVNDVLVTNNISSWALSGHVLNKPVSVDFAGTADAEGCLRVKAKSVSDTGIVVGLELLAPVGAALAAPSLKAYPSREYVRLVANDRVAEYYEYQYRDSDTSEWTTLATKAPGWGFRDLTAPTDGTRAYRARLIEGNLTGPWSEVVTATRGGRSVYEALRVNHTRHPATMANPPEGWVDGEQFRTSVHEENVLCSTTLATTTYDLSRVANPAPMDVYRSQFYANDDRKNYAFEFPGFDPEQDYIIRVHAVETWDGITKAGMRTYALGLGGAVLPANEVMDSYVAAGSNINVAAVWEVSARPALDGVIRFGVKRGNQNPVMRGTEIVPVAAGGTSFDGQVQTAWYAATADSTMRGISEPCVAEKTHAGWSWTAADVPAACASGRTRLVARGRIFVPVNGTYAFSAAANGAVRLWVNTATNLLAVDNGTVGAPQESEPVELAVGFHELLVEYLPGVEADFALTLAWTGDAGNQPLAAATMAPSVAPGLTGEWRTWQLGNAQSISELAVPSAVVQTGADAYRVAGSGNDMWGGSDDGTFFHHPASGTFEMTMRINDRGGPPVANSRLGVAVRSTLGKLTESDFMIYDGVNGVADGQVQLKAYCDVDFTAGANILSWGTTANAEKPNFPLWIKLTRERTPSGGDRYIYAHSQDNVNWYCVRTQDVRRVRNVYVGPLVMAHTAAAGRLVWMDIDNLSFVDTTPRGTLIYIR